MKKLSWVPVRKGNIYCAPACGHGCTFAAFQAATLKAETLAERLGKGWQIHVTENLGWHHAVIKGDIWVRQTGAREFYARFAHGSINATASTPRAAISELLDMALEERARWNRYCAKLNAALQKR